MLSFYFFGIAQKKTTKQVIKKPVVKELQFSNNVVQKKDFTEVDGEVQCLDKKIKLKNGEDNLVDVKFNFFAKKEYFEKTDETKITFMIEQANRSIMRKMKSPYTYTPRKITMSYLGEKDQWGVVVEYTAQNSYGALLTGKDIEYFYNDIQRQTDETKKAIEKNKAEIEKLKELMKKENDNKGSDLEIQN